MSRYACTQCMHWFSFDQLSESKQMCSACIASGADKSKDVPKKSTKKPSKDSKKFKCRYCCTDLKSASRACERCLKNLKEHGKPKICTYCKLPSAFIGSKCQRCSSNCKKYGDPIKCQKCGMKSAFDHEKAKINGLVLCWRCCVKKQKEMLRSKRKVLDNNDDRSSGARQKVMKYSPTRPYIDDGNNQDSDEDRQKVWKELLGEEKRSKGKDLPPQPSKLEGSRETKPDLTSENSMKKKEDLRKRAHLNSQKYGAHNKNDRRSLEARLSGMKKTFSAPNSPAALSPSLGINREDQNRSNKNTPKSDAEPSPSVQTPNGKLNDKSDPNLNHFNLLPTVNDHNIVVVTRLREEVSGLKKQLAKKDQQLIEKDKQVSILKVEHLSDIKSIQTKLKNQEEEYIKTIESVRLKNQELLKKIAQLSKGKA